MFTEDDLAKVKACLPEPVAPPAAKVSVSVPETNSCVNDGIEEVKKIMLDQLSKQATVIELGTITKSSQFTIENVIDSSMIQ
jgi:hypothetical protein